MRPLTYRQQRFLTWITNNPGACLADAVRALNSTLTHDTALQRARPTIRALMNKGLIKEGHIRRSSRRNGKGLYAAAYKDRANYYGIFGWTK